MSLITIIWSICAGICLAMAGLNLLVWLQARDRWANFFFSLSAVGAAASAVIELALMYAQTPADTGFWLRWMHTSVQVCVIALIWFVRAYLGAGSLWLAWLSCGLRALTLVINFLPGHANVAFREMKPPRQIVALGESVSVPDGIGTVWSLLVSGTSVLFLVYLVGAVIAAWRQGNRRRAGWLGVAISLSFLLGMTQTRLVTAGVLSIPYTMSLLFLPVLSIMGIELSSDLLRAFVLSRALRETQERMQLATSAADLGVWEWDVQKDEIWSTEGSRARVGIGSGERLNFARMLQSVHPEDREPTLLAVQQALHGPGSFEAEYRMIVPDGTTHWIAARGEVERNGNGEPLRMRGVSLDITKRKLAQLEAQELRNDLAHVSRAATMNELSGSLAHELNQPLSIILSNAQAAQEQLERKQPDLAEIRDILTDIVKADRRAAEIIQRLRAMLRRDTTAFRTLQLNDLLTEVLQLVRADLIGRRVTVTCQFASELPAIMGDRVQLQQVTLNLILNAAEAMAVSEEGLRRLFIVTAARDGKVRVSVRDSGRGLPAHLEKLFEPFFTTKTTGLGMGLTICRSIVTGHNGRIWAENHPEGGAMFHFEIPTASKEVRA